MINNNIILRNYQKDSINNAIEYIKDNPIISLPTGAGKSIVISEICKYYKDFNIIVLQPSKEILIQNYQKYNLYSNDCSIFSASLNQKEISRVCFATIGSVINKLELFQNTKLIIVDECHLVDAKNNETMYLKLLNTLNANCIGLSATPYRVHTSLNFGSQTKFLHRTKQRIFNKIAYCINPSDLIKMNFLSKLKYYDVLLFDTRILKLNMQKSDFTLSSIKFAIENKIINLTKLIQDLSFKHKHCLVFCHSISFAEELIKILNIKNFNAKSLHSEMQTDERDFNITQFKQGKIKVIINVGVLTTGFDFPELDCIILARPTLSISLYYQMVGRGLRIAKDKDCCHIYDLCGNVKRFGKVEEFTIEGLEKKENLFSTIAGVKTQLTHINRYFS